MKTFKELYPDVPWEVLETRTAYIDNALNFKVGVVKLRELYNLPSSTPSDCGISQRSVANLHNIFSG